MNLAKKSRTHGEWIFKRCSLLWWHHRGCWFLSWNKLCTKYVYIITASCFVVSGFLCCIPFIFRVYSVWMYIVFICIDMVVNILLFKPVMKEINRILFVFCTHVTFPLLNVSYLNNYVKVFCVNTFVYIQMVWLFIQVFSPWPPLFHPSQYYHQFDCLWLSKSLKNDVVVDSGIV